MSIVEKAINKHRKRKSKDRDDGRQRLNNVDAEVRQEPTLLPAEEKRGTGTVRILASESPVPEEAGERELLKNQILHLDFDALREASIVPPENLAPHLADEFRRIKRPLLANAFGKGVVPVENGNLLMVCSAFSGEGKTFTSVNLAMSLALERERTVLLIDADVAKPHISRALKLDNQLGLMDLLMNDELDLSDVMVQTDMPGLRVLPAGTRHHYATEYLASDKMQKLMEEISGRYPNRMIILDSPPLLQTSEALVLASQVGQVVLVIHAGETPQSAIQAAIEMIDPGKAINLILNKCRAKSDKEYYGGYYGQDY